MPRVNLFSRRDSGAVENRRPSPSPQPPSPLQRQPSQLPSRRPSIPVVPAAVSSSTTAALSELTAPALPLTARSTSPTAARENAFSRRDSGTAAAAPLTARPSGYTRQSPTPTPPLCGDIDGSDSSSATIPSPHGAGSSRPWAASSGSSSLLTRAQAQRLLANTNTSMATAVAHQRSSDAGPSSALPRLPSAPALPARPDTNRPAVLPSMQHRLSGPPAVGHRSPLPAGMPRQRTSVPSPPSEPPVVDVAGRDIERRSPSARGPLSCPALPSQGSGRRASRQAPLPMPALAPATVQRSQPSLLGAPLPPVGAPITGPPNDDDSDERCNGEGNGSESDDLHAGDDVPPLEEDIFVAALSPKSPPELPAASVQNVVLHGGLHVSDGPCPSSSELQASAVESETVERARSGNDSTLVSPRNDDRNTSAPVDAAAVQHRVSSLGRESDYYSPLADDRHHEFDQDRGIQCKDNGAGHSEADDTATNNAALDNDAASSVSSEFEMEPGSDAVPVAVASDAAAAAATSAAAPVPEELEPPTPRQDIAARAPVVGVRDGTQDVAAAPSELTQEFSRNATIGSASFGGTTTFAAGTATFAGTTTAGRASMLSCGRLATSDGSAGTITTVAAPATFIDQDQGRLPAVVAPAALEALLESEETATRPDAETQPPDDTKHDDDASVTKSRGSAPDRGECEDDDLKPSRSLDLGLRGVASAAATQRSVDGSQKKSRPHQSSHDASFDGTDTLGTSASLAATNNKDKVKVAMARVCDAMSPAEVSRMSFRQARHRISVELSGELGRSGSAKALFDETLSDVLSDTTPDATKPADGSCGGAGDRDPDRVGSATDAALLGEPSGVDIRLMRDVASPLSEPPDDDGAFAAKLGEGQTETSNCDEAGVEDGSVVVPRLTNSDDSRGENDGSAVAVPRLSPRPRRPSAASEVTSPEAPVPDDVGTDGPYRSRENSVCALPPPATLLEPDTSVADAMPPHPPSIGRRGSTVSSTAPMGPAPPHGAPPSQRRPSAARRCSEAPSQTDEAQSQGDSMTQEQSAGGGIATPPLAPSPPRPGRLSDSLTHAPIRSAAAVAAVPLSGAVTLCRDGHGEGEGSPPTGAAEAAATATSAPTATEGAERGKPSVETTAESLSPLHSPPCMRRRSRPATAPNSRRASSEHNGDGEDPEPAPQSAAQVADESNTLREGSQASGTQSKFSLVHHRYKDDCVTGPHLVKALMDKEAQRRAELSSTLALELGHLRSLHGGVAVREALERTLIAAAVAAAAPPPVSGPGYLTLKVAPANTDGNRGEWHPHHSQHKGETTAGGPPLKAQEDAVVAGDVAICTVRRGTSAIGRDVRLPLPFARAVPKPCTSAAAVECAELDEATGAVTIPVRDPAELLVVDVWCWAVLPPDLRYDLDLRVADDDHHRDDEDAALKKKAKAGIDAGLYPQHCGTFRTSLSGRPPCGTARLGLDVSWGFRGGAVPMDVVGLSGPVLTDADAAVRKADASAVQAETQLDVSPLLPKPKPMSTASTSTAVVLTATTGTNTTTPSPSRREEKTSGRMPCETTNATEKATEKAEPVIDTEGDNGLAAADGHKAAQAVDHHDGPDDDDDDHQEMNPEASSSADEACSESTPVATPDKVRLASATSAGDAAVAAIFHRRDSDDDDDDHDDKDSTGDDSPGDRDAKQSVGTRSHSQIPTRGTVKGRAGASAESKAGSSELAVPQRVRKPLSIVGLRPRAHELNGRERSGTARRGSDASSAAEGASFVPPFALPRIFVTPPAAVM